MSELLLKKINFSTKNSMTCSSLDSSSSNGRRLSFRACDILNNLRCQNKLCDCKIVCDDLTEFPIHRVVLSGKKYRKFLFNLLIHHLKLLAVIFMPYSQTE